MRARELVVGIAAAVAAAVDDDVVPDIPGEREHRRETARVPAAGWNVAAAAAAVALPTDKTRVARVGLRDRPRWG